MIELENAQIESVELASETYGKYEASPLPAGYGVTLGNALRRVLLSSLEGAAVTSVQIRDVSHEFSTIPGVKEDVIEIAAQPQAAPPQELRVAPDAAEAPQVGRRPVTAADIIESADVEIVNSDLHLLTLEAGAEIEMDLTVERGVGYLAAEETKELPIGVVPVDAIFTPIRRVDYHVENTRVGQMTNYDKLTIEIETDGTVSPEEALSRAAEILVGQFSQFTSAGRKLTGGRGGRGVRPTRCRRTCSTCPSRTSTCRCGPTTRSSATTSSRSGSSSSSRTRTSLRMRNFGRKSLDEMKDRLRMRGFLPPEDVDAIDDLDLEDEPFDDEEDEA